MLALLILVLVLLISTPFNAATHTIYVVANDRDQECPENAKCHSLASIIEDISSFKTDTELIFLEGNHNLNEAKPLLINQVDYFSLRGTGQWIKGPEETVMQSSVIINCTRNLGGFLFNNSTRVMISGLTFNNCGINISHPESGTTLAAIGFIAIYNLIFNQVSLQNSPGTGLLTIDCNYVQIQSSSFVNSNYIMNSNTCRKSEHWGNAAFISTLVQLTVYDSNFTRGCSRVYSRESQAGGLYVLAEKWTTPIKVKMENLLLLNNVGGSITLSVFPESQSKFDFILLNSRIMEKVKEESGLFINLLVLDSNVTTKIYIQNLILESDILTIQSDNHKGIFVISDCTTRARIRVYIMAANSPGTSCQVTLRNLTLNSGSTPHTAILIHSEPVPYESDKPQLVIENSQFNSKQYMPSLLSIHYGIDVVIKNSSFTNNSDANSVIFLTALQSASYPQRLVFENSTMYDNKMTGITAVNSEVLFSGYNIIQKHKSRKGAALQLLNGSYCIINGTLDLTDNQATDIGGALYSNSISLHNKHCTLNFFEDSQLVFSGNRALKGGSDIYGATLFNCNNTDNYFIPFAGSLNQTSRYFHTSLLKHIQFYNTDPLSSMTSYPIMVCFCNSSYQPVCSYKSSKHIESYPGAYVYASIATVGYYGGTSPGTVIFKTSEMILLEPKCSLATTVNCSTVRISLEKSTSALASIGMSVDGGLPGWEVTMNIQFIDCPFGFSLDERAKVCQCARVLRAFNVTCDINTQEFTRSGNKWIAFLNSSACIITYNNCPFDYCNTSSVSFDLKESGSDYQCANNRTGILCGQCKQGLSLMLGSNNCATCSNIYLLMLVPIAVAGFVLIAVMMTLNLTVSVGAINGLLFYANMVKLNEAFFFPNGNIPVISQFISWLNLDLGIDVCFIDGLNGYWKTWLQFAFPAYLYLIIGVIIVSWNYSTRFSRWWCKLCSCRPVSVFATLNLMSYTKILRVISNALSMAQIVCNDNVMLVWKFDGSVTYGSLKHLILVIISLFILLFLVTCTLILTFTSISKESYKKCFLENNCSTAILNCLARITKCNALDECIYKIKCSAINNLGPIVHSYEKPYKPSCHSWTGILMTMRLTAVVIFTFSSLNFLILNCSVIFSITITVIGFWVFNKGVYNSTFLNIIDMCNLINLAILCNVTSTAIQYNSSFVEITTIVSVSLAILTFVIICIYQFDQNWNVRNKLRKCFCTANDLSISAEECSTDHLDSPPIQDCPADEGVSQFDLFMNNPAGQCLNSPSLPLILVARQSKKQDGII